MTSASAEGPEGTEGIAAAPAASPMRVFVGLKIAPEIACQLAQLAAGLERPSARQIPPDDIHLTLVPPWNEPSPRLAIEKLGAVAGRFGAFSLIFEHAGYGPQPRRPRLVWVDCAAGEEIAALRGALMQACGQSEDRPFQPHVTLARIRGNGSAIARKHPIDQRLSLTQRIESIQFFQSPPPDARGYRILASLRLGRAARSVPPS